VYNNRELILSGCEQVEMNTVIDIGNLFLFPIIIIGAIAYGVWQRPILLACIWLAGVCLTCFALDLHALFASIAWEPVLVSGAWGGLAIVFVASFEMWRRWIHKGEIPILTPGHPALFPGFFLPGIVLAYHYAQGYSRETNWIQMTLALIPTITVCLLLWWVLKTVRKAKRAREQAVPPAE
jgi:hypothetical protein